MLDNHSTGQFSLFAASRADQIFERFCKFHEANPRLWELFQQFALDVARRGRERYSVSAIVERIRWHVDIETGGADVKINNDFKAYYGRMFMAKFPQYPIFETRRLLSAEAPAYGEDVPVMPPLPAAGEEALIDRLRVMAGPRTPEGNPQ